MQLNYPENILECEEIEDNTYQYLLFDEILKGTNYRVEELHFLGDANYVEQHTRYLIIDGSVQSAAEDDTNMPLQFEYLEAMLGICEEVFRQKEEKLSILCLGGGAMALPQVLLAKGIAKKLVVVEKDPYVIELTKHYFMDGFQKQALDYSGLTLVEDDALSYLENSADHFDLILNDVFVGGSIFAPLYTKAAIDLQKQKLVPGGFILSNILGSVGDTENPFGLEKILASYKGAFTTAAALPMSEEGALAFTETEADNFVVVASDTKFQR